MQYSTVKNPKWSTPNHTHIDVDVYFPHLKQEVSFTATIDDIEDHGREIYQRIIRGEFGPIKEYKE